jgi:hypothetical protein
VVQPVDGYRGSLPPAIVHAGPEFIWGMSDKEATMFAKGKIWPCALIAVLGLLATTLNANALCVLAGNWLFYNLRINTASTNKPSVNTCTIKVVADGNFTGVCTGYPLGGSPAPPLM